MSTGAATQTGSPTPADPPTGADSPSRPYHRAPDALEVDDTAWDALVESSDPGSYLQLSGWSRVKAVNGWTAVRFAADSADGAIGAQVLVRRPRPLPWGFAYAPRGPVAAAWAEDSLAALTDTIRARMRERAGRVSHLRIDPEIELDAGPDAGGAVRHALRRAGWRPADPIQPASTRLIDLAVGEDVLWSDLRKKWRQYVNKARSGGLQVVDAGPERFGEFYRIYRDTAERAGFLIRTEAAYRDVWDAYAPHDRARLLFAQTPDGDAQATLFLVRAGPRIVEPYGGMTRAGAESRANYLLKWEAIRSSRERGATSYDLWGLATGGIAHFKAGFGGREVRYVGAWDLVLDPLGRRTYMAAQRGSTWLARRRAGLPTAGGAAGAAAFEGDG